MIILLESIFVGFYSLLISFIIFIHEHFKVTTMIVKHIPNDDTIFTRLTAMLFPSDSGPSASGPSASGPSASGPSSSAGSGASIGGSRRKYRKTRTKKAKKGKSKIESRARRMRNRKTHNAL